MRIALTHQHCWPEVRRGGERYLHELGTALAAAGHEVSILSSATRADREVTGGVAVRRYARPRGLRGPVTDQLVFGAEALATLARRPPDVWHALGPADGAAATLLGRLSPLRSVYTDLGLPWRWYWDGRPDRFLHRQVVRHVDRFVCLSAAAATALSSYGRRGVVVPGGVDHARFVPARGRAGTPTLLFSGRLDEPRKRLGLLLRSIPIIRRRLPELRLVLSGPGDPGPLLAEAPPGATEAVEVRGLGGIDEQVGRYATSWVTVLPSAHEAFGLVLIESLACGTPIVTLEDAGGPVELVEEGIGAIGAPSPEGLAEACLRSLELAARPETTARCREAAHRFDWRTGIVPMLEGVYS